MLPLLASLSWTFCSDPLVCEPPPCPPVPLLHRILPSDTCKIYKRGASIRLDTTLVDFADFKWERGDVSFLFNGDAPPAESLSVLDNKLRVFQTVRYEVRDACQRSPRRVDARHTRAAWPRSWAFSVSGSCLFKFRAVLQVWLMTMLVLCCVSR